MFAGYILEQSVSFRAVLELIVGGGGGGGTVRNFRQSFVPVLHTSGQAVLKCLNKQNFTEICHVGKELQMYNH